MKRFAIIAAATLAATPLSAAMVVTSLADFNTQTAGQAAPVLDTFDIDIAGGVTITQSTGVVSTLSGGDLSYATGNLDNAVRDGVFYGAIDGDGSLAALTLTFDFGANVVAFGFDAFTVDTVNVSVDSGATLFDVNTEIGDDDGFFGLVDLANPFQTLQFTGQGTTSDFFQLDTLRFVFADDIAAVPLPASIMFLAAGLGGLGLMRRKS